MHRRGPARSLALASVLALALTTAAGAQEPPAAPDASDAVATATTVAADEHDGGPPDPVRFQQTLIEDDLTAGIRLRVTDDGRVVFIERAGAVRVWDPDTGTSSTAAELDVYEGGEVGLIGLELAPDFDTTGDLYLHYAPPNWEEHYITRVSRFTLDGDTIALDDEVQIYDVQHPEGYGGWHSAGDLRGTPDGLLFIATGDNTGCCDSAGYAPHDEREAREDHDAQRTSANTNDPNGKILRIRPLEDGGYEIPDGNLFEEGTPDTLPEIYAMGFRNPFAMGGYDESTDTLWMGDYGPDALFDDERGPKGHVKLHAIDEPGFFGWPYCTADNQAYTDWDYEADEARGVFDCDAPTNTSPNNTGLTELPPAQPAEIWYSFIPDEPFPELYGGGAHGGPMYSYDPDSPSDTKFPEWFDGRWFFNDWVQDWIYTVELDEEGDVVDLHEFGPDLDIRRPMSMEFGPDGALYVMAYGLSWSGDSDDAGIYRVDYDAGNLPPEVDLSVSTDSGPLPLEVEFDASGTTDVDGDDLTFAWDLGDGTTVGDEPTLTHTYTDAGAYEATVTVSDGTDESSASVEVVAGNTRPTVELVTPPDGSFADLDDDIPYRVAVSDPEDGDAIDCSQVTVTYSVGVDETIDERFTDTPDASCEGVLSPDTDHVSANAYAYHVVEASYTDAGGDGAPALTGQDQAVVHPFTRVGNQYREVNAGHLFFGQLMLTEPGAWARFPRINLGDIGEIDLELSSRGEGAVMRVHAGSPDGPVAAEVAIPDTGAPDSLAWEFQTFTSQVTDPGGVNDLYFVVERAEGADPGDAFPELFFRDITFHPADPVDPTDPDHDTVCDRHQGGATFPDVPGSGHGYFIDCLAELGIVQGKTDGTFAPREDVSRGQLASFVVRALEEATGEEMDVAGDPFPDVGVHSTHGSAIHKLRTAGVIRGYEDGTFAPRDAVSRDQTARYVVNALELLLDEPLTRDGASFPDVASGSQYADDIDALVSAGVVSGFEDGTYGPREPVTRAQMTRFIGNALDVLAEAGAYAGR